MAHLTAEQQKHRHALGEARRIVERVAREQRTISYSDLVDGMTTRYAANGEALTDLLCAISRESLKKDRGLLSAVVVEKRTGRPAPGFFAFAENEGFDTTDEAAFWQDAVDTVHAIWSGSAT